MSKSESYLDDRIQLDRYHNLLEALCAKEVGRIRSMYWVDSIDKPVFDEEPHGVHVTLHDIFADDASDALYEVSYEFFVAYSGGFRLQEFSVEPVPAPVSAPDYDIAVDDLPFWN